MQRRVAGEYVCGAIVAIIVHPRARATRRERELGIIRPRAFEVAAGDVHGNAEAGRQHDAHRPDLHVELVDLPGSEGPLVVVHVVGPVGQRHAGRPKIGTEIRALIRRMSKANPLWGAPRIHGELLKLGIKISQATVGRWMPWRPKVPSPSWRSFLHNHLPDIAAIDMFVVATATFRLLYALIVLSLDRRRVVHFEVTQNPTQVWLSGQMTEAFPWDTAPRYLLRDRDKSYGPAFRYRVRAMGITEVITAPRSPWQNPYIERLIGSIRRECLDHVIILNERHLRRVLSS